jgi:hypothetical protein
MALLCKPDHRMVHESGWTIRMANGYPEFIPPEWLDAGSMPTKRHDENHAPHSGGTNSNRPMSDITDELRPHLKRCVTLGNRGARRRRRTVRVGADERRRHARRGPQTQRLP